MQILVSKRLAKFSKQTACKGINRNYVDYWELLEIIMDYWDLLGQGGPENFQGITKLFLELSGGS